MYASRDGCCLTWHMCTLPEPLCMQAEMAAAGLGICAHWTEPLCLQAEMAAAGLCICAHWT